MGFVGALTFSITKNVGPSAKDGRGKLGEKLRYKAAERSMRGCPRSSTYMWKVFCGFLGCGSGDEACDVDGDGDMT